MRTVVFGCFGSKIKIAIWAEDWVEVNWKAVKHKAWQELAKKLRQPVSKLKKTYCPIKNLNFDLDRLPVVIL